MILYFTPIISPSSFMGRICGELFSYHIRQFIMGISGSDNLLLKIFCRLWGFMLKNIQIIVLCLLIPSLLISGTTDKIFGSNANHITILQNGDGSLDIDFVLPGETIPSFRLLCPEHIGTIDRNLGEEVGAKYFHMAKGKSHSQDGVLVIEHSFPKVFDFQIKIIPQTSYVDLEVTVKNTGEKSWKDLTANFCAGLTRLPGNPPWANRKFFPEMELDRYLHGKYWYSKITPQRLKCYSGNGWELLHPHSDNPDPSLVPQYPVSLANAKSTGIVALEPDGNQPQFFILWDKEGQACDPFPGNACMHLSPLIAHSVNPGESGTINGKIGFWGKSLNDLVKLNKELKINRTANER